ncbi:hypothetical protein HYU11_02180 [Candidatus Woesearchaeota archaeon]|nr:hypothetical protein [Candidatus Woesearchaeota archaeon]
MKQVKELEKVYNQCISEGYLQEPEEIDFEKVKSLLALAIQDLNTLKQTIPIMEKMENYSLIWSGKYEIIRQLVQGILFLEKISSNNHQCLYAYICVKHDDWDIDWETIETMRLLRNKIHYEGRPVSKDVWDRYKLKFDIYEDIFIKLLKEKLIEQENKNNN